MIRQLKLIWMLIKMKLSHMMVFRLSFFGAFFVDGTMFAILLLVFSAIYANVDSIGGWTRGEMIVFIGTFSLINAINMVVYFFGVLDIPNKIIHGGLDHYLTKPMNPLLRLTFENVNPGSLPLVFASIGIIVYGVTQMNTCVTPLKVAGYVILVLLMTVLWYDVELILRTVPFFVISAQKIDRVEELLVLCFKVPGTLFKGAFKVLFYFVLPYGIMATIPTQMIAGTLSPLGFVYGVSIVVLFTAFALWLWKFGLKHYKSASS
jgi:ABC-2 type transport system permease protein